MISGKQTRIYISRFPVEKPAESNFYRIRKVIRYMPILYTLINIRLPYTRDVRASDVILPISTIQARIIYLHRRVTYLRDCHRLHVYNIIIYYVNNKSIM